MTTPAQLTKFLDELGKHEGAALLNGVVSYYDAGANSFSPSAIDPTVFQDAKESGKVGKTEMVFAGAPAPKPSGKIEIIFLKKLATEKAKPR